MARKRSEETPRPSKAGAPSGKGPADCFILGTLATSVTLNLECARKDLVGLRFAEAAEGVGRARKDISILADRVPAKGLTTLIRKVEREAAVLEVEMRNLARSGTARIREALLMKFARVLERHNTAALKIARDKCGVPIPETQTTRPKGS
jgi:hypothetical protein